MADQSKIKELMKEYGQLERQAKALFKKANDAYAKLWAAPDGSAEAKRYNAEWKRLEAEGVKFREKANRILDRVERMEKENPTRRRNKTIIMKPKKVVVIKKNPVGKPARRKYRNGYLDLVIMGRAKKTSDGWMLGGKTFKQGKGIVPASKRGYYLDRATGTVFSKNARNSAKKRNLDHRDAQHPIHVTDYWQGRKGYLTPWQRAHHAGQKDLFAHGIKAAKKRNPHLTESEIAKLPILQRTRVENTMMSARLRGDSGIHATLNADKSVTVQWTGDYGTISDTYDRKGKSKNPVRNPRYLVIGIDDRGREYDLAVHVDANKTQTLAWAKRQYPGYKKYAISLSDKADYIGRSGMVKAKRPKRLSKRNPSPADNRREFAGSYTGDKKLRFPDGTPSGLSKLGTLKLIKTEAGTLKPSQGTAWLCRDQKGKLHIGTTRLDGVVYNGNAGSFGKVELIEYDETKKHLYPNSGRIRFYHKMGEEDGKQPVLYSDGKGGLKFKGGNYRIESRGIVN